MKIVPGKVVDGRVELPPGAADEGSDVTVLVPDGESTFTLSDEQVRRLQASIDQTSKGEVIDAASLLEEFRG